MKIWHQRKRSSINNGMAKIWRKAWHQSVSSINSECRSECGGMALMAIMAAWRGNKREIMAKAGEKKKWRQAASALKALRSGMAAAMA